MIKSNIGKYLSLAGLTQRELAERVGATEVSISRYASGKRIPNATTCIRIANVLNCKAEDLFEEVSDNELAMSENEAIEFLKGKYPSWGCDEDEYENAITAIKALEEIKAYRAIGTVEEFKALKEKNEPKKPQEISWGATKCPICGQDFGFNSHFNHCSNCGQKLDFQ